jgi:Arc/MetJ-type ribon-helix-helix transcriptional regulator
MASRTVRARLDKPSEQALDLLMREGRNESEAVREALVEAGMRRTRRSALADEVSRLADDPDDREERRALMADLDAVSADWPS